MTVEPAAAPDRRSGRACGYPHRAELLAGVRALSKHLTALARDPDPQARLAGAAIAAEVAAAIHTAAARADAASSRSRKIAASLAQDLPRIQARLDHATKLAGSQAGRDAH